MTQGHDLRFWREAARALPRHSLAAIHHKASQLVHHGRLAARGVSQVRAEAGGATGEGQEQRFYQRPYTAVRP